jgi:hypothetical protein
MHHRLAAGEIIFAHAERLGLVEQRQDVRGLHHRDAIFFRSAGDEAVAAGDVAQRSGELEPQRVEAGQTDLGCERRVDGVAQRQDREAQTHRPRI